MLSVFYHARFFARRTKPLLWSGGNWRRRFIVWIAAGLVGLVAAAFAGLAIDAEAVFAKIIAVSPWLCLIVSPGGLAFSAWMTIHVFPGSQGSGIPQAIAAREIEEPHLLHRLLSLRIAFGKILMTLGGLLAGASIGREGPTAQVGASLMLAAGDIAGIGRRNVMILAGGAAGVAAAFNTPLAGIVFAIEELARSFDRRSSGLILGAIVLAAVASISVLGGGSYFGHTDAQLESWWQWVVVVPIAVSGGLLGGLFSRSVIWAGRNIQSLYGGWFGRHPVVLAALCGLGVGILGLLSGGDTYGTGYEQARAALVGHLNEPFIYFGLKFLANIVSQMAGIPGGFFAPSLAVGAGLGSGIAHFLPMIPAGALVILGMASFFAAVVQAPITGFVIVFEMTDNHSMVPPLIITSLIACGTARLISPEPLYHTLAAGFLKRLRDSEREQKQKKP